MAEGDKDADADAGADADAVADADAAAGAVADAVADAGAVAGTGTGTGRSRQRIGVEIVVGAVAVLLVAWAWHADAWWWEQHAKPYRCIREPHTLSLGNFARFCAVVVAALLAFVVRPLLARRALRQGLRAGGFVRSGVAVLLALLVTEAILRRPKPAPPAGRPDFTPPTVYSECCMWTLEPSHEHRWHAGGREFSYLVNAEGHRARSIDTVWDHARPTILVAGESLALGMGVPYEDTFAALLEDRTGMQVVVLAQPGYSLDQAYLRLAQDLPKFERPVAVVGFVVPDEVWRAEYEDRPRLRFVDGNLVKVGPEPEWKRDLRLRRLWRDAYHGDAEMVDVRAQVRAMRDLAQSRGAQAVFVFTNAAEACHDVLGKAPWLYRTLFEDQGIPGVRVDIAENLRLSGGDAHPGPEGHRLLADAIEGALRAQRVIP